MKGLCLTLVALLPLSACRTEADANAKVLESLPGATGEPPDIAPAPSSDESSTACDANRIWKYADLSYKTPQAVAAAIANDQSFPGAVVLGRFVSMGNAGEVAPTYLIRDASSCNILISVRGTASFEDGGTDANLIGGRNDGLLSGLQPGVAHRGFANATLGINGYEGILQDQVEGETLLEKIAEAAKACKAPRGAHVLVTGHSLGGAVATLIHFILLEKGYDSRLVTYGSPRAISSGALAPYASAQNKRSHWGPDVRVAGTNDTITYVPPAIGGFRHFPGTLLSVYRGGHTGATYGYADSMKYLCDNDVAQRKAQRGEGSPLVSPGCAAVVLPPNLRGASGPCFDAVGSHETGWYQLVSTSLSRYWTCSEVLAAKREASDNPLWQTEYDKCRGKVVRCVAYINQTCPFATGTEVDGLHQCAMTGSTISDRKTCRDSPCAGNPAPVQAMNYLNGTLWSDRNDALICKDQRWQLKTIPMGP